MALIESQVLFRELQDQKFHPIYTFWGEEIFLLEETLKSLKDHLLPESAADFNLNVFFAKEDDAATIRDAALDFPVFVPRRVVIVRQMELFSDKEWEILTPLIAEPVESTVLIFVASEIDKRKKWFKTLLEKSTCVEFKKPLDQHVPSYVKSFSERLGCEISSEASQLMFRLKGPHLQEIFLELKKLADYIHPRKLIEVEDVTSVVSHSREENVFELMDAIGSKNQSQGLLLLVKLLDQGQSEIGIVALVARHIRILLGLKEGQKKGLQGQKLALQAGIPHFFLNKYLGQLRDWSTENLLYILDVLADTDMALKSSPLSSHIWLENLILKACNLESSSAERLSL